MAVSLIVQNDEGDVADANAYTTLAYFQDYHAKRGNSYVGTDDKVKSRIIRSTDYLDTRFDFRGIKRNNGTKATGTLTGTANFVEGETVTIGTIAWTFRASPALAHDVLLGGTLAISLAGLSAAVAIESDDVSVGSTTATTLVVIALEGGVAGNDIATTDTGANASWGATTLEGGASAQTTEWPRKAGSDTNLAFISTLDTGVLLLDPVTFALDVNTNLIGPDGQDIVGIPAALKRACAEYSLRALSILLFEDAPAPEGGRLLDEESVTVDVISQSKKYHSPQSGAFVMPAYPAADLLLARAGLIMAGRTLMR